MPEALTTSITTPLGPLLARASDAGLLSLTFVDPTTPTHEPFTPTRLTSPTPFSPSTPTAAAHLRTLESQLTAYFAGALSTFSIPLTAPGTPFQHAVWSALVAIPAGQTRSYAEIALAIGRPDAVRAVARANSTNPIAILVPCHRVIGTDGSLTGYAAGLDRKRLLLDHERRHWGTPAADTLWTAGSTAQ